MTETDHPDGPAGWRLGNVPLPEPHLAGLAAGVALQVVRPWPLPWPGRAGQAVGWPLLLGGLGLAAWAVRAAGGVDLARPDRLVATRPYSFSRNPMYLGATLAYVAVAPLAGSAWLLALLPAVLLATHLVVLAEERSLERRFGAAYRGYRARVRRYL
jgi:protein-S-isoprenylcysteine O-methyltransferase Ste14